MRVDDRPLLEWLVTMTGIGALYFHRAQPHGRHPTMEWRVHRTKDLMSLANLLTRYPLHGKKRRDFEIWTRAVRLAATTVRPGSRPSYHNARIRWRLLELKRELQDVRRYDGSGDGPPASAPVENPLTLF
jgi:hypothetical protein